MGNNDLLVLSHTLGEPGDITNETLGQGQFLASIRLQLIPAIKAGLSLGLKPRVLALRSERPELIDAIGTPKACLIGKLSHPDEGLQQRIALANLAAITRLKRRGVPVALIYSDNIAEEAGTTRGEMARDLLELADMLIFPCKAMEKNATKWMKDDQQRAVIVDPWQVAEYPYLPQQLSQETRVIWFGHGANAEYLLRHLDDILNTELLTRSRVFTALSDMQTLGHIKERMGSLTIRNKWQIRLVKWDVENQPNQLEQELSASHIAVIPSDENDPRKNGVSHNRAVDAIRAGCVVVASPVESYRELRGCMLIGSSFSKILKHAHNNYEPLARTFQARRRVLLAEFAPEINIRNWKQVLSCLKRD